MGQSEGAGAAGAAAGQAAHAATPPRPDTFPPVAPAGTTIADLTKETKRDSQYVYHNHVRVEIALDADWVKAQTYLAKSPEAINSLYDLEHGSKDVTVSGIHDGNDRFNPRSNTIYWDPNSAMVTTNGGKQTAANGLLHEQGHANEFKNNPERFARDSRTAVPGYDNAEERRNIQWETVYSKELGEGTRTDHRGSPYDAKGPTSLEPARTAALEQPSEIRNAIHTARQSLSTHGMAAPPEAGNGTTDVVKWDGKPHSGPVLHLDGNTVAQAVTDQAGHTQYQVYDVNKDLGGQFPPAGGARTTILENGRVAGPAPQSNDVTVGR